MTYGSLLRERRRALDARILSAIERLYPDRPAAQLGRLAHHALRGELWKEALTYTREASARALDRSALTEALLHTDHALEALAHLDLGQEQKSMGLVLMTQRAMALRGLRGYAAPEVEQIYIDARELCREVPDAPETFGLEWQQMQFFLVRAELETAKQIALRLLQYAEARQEAGLLVDAHLAAGMTAFASGEFATARDHFERGVALCPADADQPHLVTHGQCPDVFCLGYLAWTLWFLGWPDRAAECAARAVASAKQRGHAFTYVSALLFAARVHQGRRETEHVRAVAAQIVALAKEHGFAYYEAQGLVHEGWARVMLVADEAGYVQLKEGCTALQNTGTVLGVPGALVLAVEVCQKLGRMDEARQILDHIRNSKEGSRVRFWDAEIARLNAELASHGALHDPAVARRYYRAALTTARAQGAQALELRAAVSYAQAYPGDGDDGKALASLAEVVSAFNEPADIVERREVPSRSV